MSRADPAIRQCSNGVSGSEQRKASQIDVMVRASALPAVSPGKSKLVTPRLVARMFILVLLTLPLAWSALPPGVSMATLP